MAAATFFFFLLISVSTLNLIVAYMPSRAVAALLAKDPFGLKGLLLGITETVALTVLVIVPYGLWHLFRPSPE